MFVKEGKRVQMGVPRRDLIMTSIISLVGWTGFEVIRGGCYADPLKIP